ncbi:partial Nucleotide-binding protein ExpZ, partial [uncultured bacterium]
MSKQILSIQKLNIEVENKTLLKEVSASVSIDKKIGLVGANGSGKTSLLNAIITQQTGIFLFGTIYYVPQLDLELLNQK